MASIFESLAVTGHRKSNGNPNATGRAWFYQPGSSTPATVYSGADELSVLSQPVTLNAGGKAAVYFSGQVDVRFEDSTGAFLETMRLGERAERIEVKNAGFTGILPSGSLGGGGKTNLNAVLSSIYASLGGLDGLYKEFTGATARSYQSVIRGIQVSVKDYGAVGNGAKDDTIAIQAAINEVRRLGGGVVYFDPGTYLISSPLLLTSVNGVSFRGAGANVSIIKNTNVTANAISLTSCSAFYVEDVAIANSGSNSGVGLSLSGCTNVRVMGLKVTGHQFAVRVTGTAPANILIGGMSSLAADSSFGGNATAVLVDPATSPTAGTFLSIVGCTLDGAGAGTGVKYGGSANQCNVIGCNFGASAIGVWFAAGMTGSGFRILGNETPSGLPVFFGVATEPADLYVDNLDLTTMTTDLTSGGSYTPDRSRGSIHRIRGTTTGVAYTVAAATPTPARDGTILVLHFYNNAGGAVTGWTLNAVYHVNSAISTVDTNHTMLTLRWDASASVWREVARGVTT